MQGGDGRDTFYLVGAIFSTDIIAGGEGGDDFDTIDMLAVTGDVSVTFTGFEQGNLSATTGGNANFPRSRPSSPTPATM